MSKKQTVNPFVSFESGAELDDYIKSNIASIVKQGMSAWMIAVIQDSGLPMDILASFPVKLQAAADAYNAEIEKQERITREFVGVVKRNAGHIGSEAAILENTLLAIAELYPNLPAASDKCKAAIDKRAVFADKRKAAHNSMSELRKFMRKIDKVMPRDKANKQSDAGLPHLHFAVNYVSILQSGQVRLHSSPHASNSVVACVQPDSVADSDSDNANEYKFGYVDNLNELSHIGIGTSGGGNADETVSAMLQHIQALVDKFPNMAINRPKWDKTSTDKRAEIALMEQCELALSETWNSARKVTGIVDGATGKIVRLFSTPSGETVELDANNS